MARCTFNWVWLTALSLFVQAVVGDACPGNTPSTRSQWCEYNINDDYYNEDVDTGNTVEYWFEITNTTLSPDGVSRQVQAISSSPTCFFTRSAFLTAMKTARYQVLSSTPIGEILSRFMLQMPSRTMAHPCISMEYDKIIQIRMMESVP